MNWFAVFARLVQLSTKPCGNRVFYQKVTSRGAQSSQLCKTSGNRFCLASLSARHCVHVEESRGGGQVLKKSLHCSNVLQETANGDTETALLQHLQYGFDPAMHLRMCEYVKHMESPAGFPRERLCSDNPNTCRCALLDQAQCDY